MAAEDGRLGEVGEVLTQLVSMHVAPERIDAVLHVASRLLESSLTTSPSIQTAESLSHAILFRLVRDGRHAESTQMAELTAGLRFERALKPEAMWSVLYVLNDLRGSAREVSRGLLTRHPKRSALGEKDSEPNGGRPSTKILSEENENYSDYDRDGGFGAPSINTNPFHAGIEPVTLNPTPLGGIGGGVESDDDGDEFFIMGRSRTAGEARLNDREDGQMESDSEAPQATNRAIISPHSTQVVSTPLYNKSLEKRLARDLLLLVQGESGDLLSFSQTDDADESIQFTMPAGTSVTTPIHDVVMCAAEVGFLFRIIQQRVQEENRESRGLVAQNMCRAVVREMDTYYRSLVTLRSIDKLEDDENDNSVGLSLRKIYVWAANEKPRLRWLARLCEETRQLEGGEILAHLRAHRGSYLPPDVHDMMSRILASTAAPINRMLQRWLSEGVLADPHQEFFIMEDPKVAAATRPTPYSAAALVEDVGVSGGLAGGPNSASMASQRIWWGLFKIRREQLPGRMDEDLAKKALIAGKSIAFMRRCCGDAGWVDQDHAPLVAGLTSDGRKLFESDGRIDEDAVRVIIEEAKESASRRLKELFFDKFDLSHHFGAIKKYLLLSQGDFSQALMDGLAPILDGDAGILRNNLTGIVDAALQTCSSFNEETDQDILERLDVQIAPQNKDTSVGWDVFSLTYRVEDAPLNTVFSPKVMEAYLLIFRLLWRLKRMDHLMGAAYINLCSFDDLKARRRSANEDEEWKEVMKVVRKAHFLRMKMTQLVQNMQHYCTVEVLEGSWTILERSMNSAEDLDEMIQAHSVYLTRIKDRTLLSERSAYVACELDAVLKVIPKFDAAQQEMSKWVKRKRYGGVYVEAEKVEGMMEGMTEIERELNESWEKFLRALKKHCRIVDSCVYLLFRLDFNGHYARRREERGEARMEASPMVVGGATRGLARD